MKHCAIIVAGGSGLRMKSEVPKQFMILNNLPILMHTLNCFYTYDQEIEIILVLPQDQVEYWKQLCIDHQFGIEHTIALGGHTRFHSVRNGLDVAPKEKALIAIHDGVRPLVSVDVIDRCYKMAMEHGGVVPVVPMIDSLRQKEENKTKRVDRSLFYRVQTPQTFRAESIYKAYECDYSNKFTDDASVYESSIGDIKIVDGDEKNMKVTHPIDIKIAECLLNS